MICYCFGISREAVRTHFARPGARLDDFITATGITTKCTACAIDLDVMLDEVNEAAVAGRSAAREDVPRRGWRTAIERVDSGFLVCDGSMRTSVRLANYPPYFENLALCAPHHFKLMLFDNDGRACARAKGRVEPGEETTIDLSALAGCPPQGWFLLRQRPESAGHYGTMRPQAVLDGGTWVACYHTQFHTDAARDGRRSSTPLRSVAGRTRALISIINGSARATDFRATLEGGSSAQTAEGKLLGNGACFLDVDTVFPKLPPGAPLILRVQSTQPTRKNLLNRHPDGSFGVDHFPNLV